MDIGQESLNLHVDHLVWGGPSLEAEIERLERWTGVRALPAGRHPSEGTHNAILGLGKTAYLELIAPDPTGRPPAHPRWLGLDTLTTPRLITWAVKATDLPDRAARARTQAVDLGEVKSGRRERSDGTLLSWQLTYPGRLIEGGVVPFLIDWASSPHPADSAPRGIELLELWGEHPDPAWVRASLGALGVELEVVNGPVPGLVAILGTPKGKVELR